MNPIPPWHRADKLVAKPMGLSRIGSGWQTGVAMWDALWIDLKVATMGDGEGTPYGLIPDGVVATDGGQIAWAGPRDALPADPRSLARRVYQGGGAVITPGLIDPHTHLVYAGTGTTDF